MRFKLEYTYDGISATDLIKVIAGFEGELKQMDRKLALSRFEITPDSDEKNG